MQRAQRLDMVQRVVDDLERRKAEALATCERNVTQSQAKLAELEAYQASYVRDFAFRAESGMNGASARDYQAFLTRLDEALRQQNQVVIRARVQRDAELRNWQSAAQRAEAVGQIVKQWKTEERHMVDRREQHESDERSQRPWTLGMQTRDA